MSRKRLLHIVALSRVSLFAVLINFDIFYYERTSGGATVIKMVRQNRGAAGAEASAEGTRMEAP